MKKPNRSTERGSTILEFAIIGPFLVMLLFGTVGVGLTLGRYMLALQVCRDVAHMYADGIDFSVAQNKSIAVQLASGTGMTAGGGSGVVILSRISTVYQADCDAAGYTNTCTNLGLPVFTQRITIGDSTLRSSAFGTPAAAILNSQGNIAPSVYLQNTDATVRTTGFAALLTAAGATQNQGDAAWVTEVYFPYPDVSYLGTITPTGAYVRYIF